MVNILKIKQKLHYNQSKCQNNQFLKRISVTIKDYLVFFSITTNNITKKVNNYLNQFEFKHKIIPGSIF